MVISNLINKVALSHLYASFSQVLLPKKSFSQVSDTLFLFLLGFILFYFLVFLFPFEHSHPKRLKKASQKLSAFISLSAIKMP